MRITKHLINRVRQDAVRARRFGVSGAYTADEWIALCAFYDFRCVCCGRVETANDDQIRDYGRDVWLVADHVVSLSKGGTNTIDNLQPLCQVCNMRKGRKTIDYRAAPFTGTLQLEVPRR